MQFQDDRTDDMLATPHVIVMMTDSFLSGWGGAKGGPSYAGWACKYDDSGAVEQWVRSRSDAKRVRIVGSDYRPPSGMGHCHIYEVGEGHPSTRRCPPTAKGETNGICTL